MINSNSIFPLFSVLFQWVLSTKSSDMAREHQVSTAINALTRPLLWTRSSRNSKRHSSSRCTCSSNNSNRSSTLSGKNPTKRSRTIIVQTRSPMVESVMTSQPLLKRPTPQDPMAVLQRKSGSASLTLSGLSTTKITLATLTDKKWLHWRKLLSPRLAMVRLLTKLFVMLSSMRSTLMETELLIRASCSASWKASCEAKNFPYSAND